MRAGHGSHGVLKNIQSDIRPTRAAYRVRCCPRASEAPWTSWTPRGGPLCPSVRSVMESLSFLDLALVMSLTIMFTIRPNSRHHYLLVQSFWSDEVVKDGMTSDLDCPSYLGLPGKKGNSHVVVPRNVPLMFKLAS